MNLYLVTLSYAAVGKWLVFAASEKQAAELIADELNYRWTDITYQWSDFDVKAIDIDSIRTPTIL
nr:hypothetical protein [Limosilactobacillus mucosae]